MLSKTLLTGLLLIAGFVAFSVVGCNEGDSKLPAMADIFPSGSIEEQITSTDRSVKKIVRLTDSSQKVLGYRVEMQVVSRSGPFDIMIALDDKACVLAVKVVKYRAVHGKQVRSKAFTRQFTGKCPGDALVVGKDIDAISRATLSAKAMTAGVKRAIDIVTTHTDRKQNKSV